jgi:cation-transporting P-type ATPase C
MPRPRTTVILCHTIPGRLRLKVPPLPGSEPTLPRAVEWLRQAVQVKDIEFRPLTGSLILTYDPKVLRAEELLESIRAAARLAGFTVSGIGEERRPRAKPARAATRIFGLPLPLIAPLAAAVALSAFLGYTVVRRVFLGRPLSQGPFSATGLVAAAGTLPLLYRSCRDLRRGRRAGLFPFLAGAAILGIATGQALTSLEILWVLSIGVFLEEWMVDRAKRAVQEILRVTPEKALLLAEGREVEMPAEALAAGDIVVVRTGKRLPADGAVIQGEALVDEAHISGRAEPELRRPGDPVYAGTRVVEGTLQVRAEKVGEETYLSRTASLLEEALARRGEVEKRADILASRLTRLGIAATLATLALTRSLPRSLSVMLVLACPCATVLAASTAIAAAVANAARNHILIKGGIYLEQAARVQCLCLDKTGTVTAGVPEILAVVPRTPWHGAEGRILAMAAAAEAGSGHPVAKALRGAAGARGIEVAREVACEVVLGRGVRAKIGDDEVVVGNEDFMKAEGVKTTYFRRAAAERLESCHTVLYVARNGKLQGMIALANTPRPGTAAVLARLRREGLQRFYLVSGDAEPVVKSLAGAIGCDGYRAALLPAEKAGFVEELEAGGTKVLMVGDGVNDALALAKATVGVAMGAGGSEVAVEAADIALADDRLEGLLFLRRLSRKTLRTVEQNFWFATATNVIGIALGMSGVLAPVMAGAFHVAHTAGIMLNSSRLLRWEGGSRRAERDT